MKIDFYDDVCDGMCMMKKQATTSFLVVVQAMSLICVDLSSLSIRSLA